MRVLLLISLLVASTAALACDVRFDCAARTMSVNDKSFPIVCGRLTGAGISGGTIGHVIRANGRWRPGLVRPGTPMIPTMPALCFDCFIHVSATGRGATSLGCIGTTSAGFSALQACTGSQFSIARKG
jgi:hypothetical protein